MKLLQGTRAQGVSPPSGVCPSSDSLRTELEEVKVRVAYLTSQVTSFLQKQFREQSEAELDMRCSQLIDSGPMGTPPISQYILQWEKWVAGRVGNCCWLVENLKGS